MLQPVIFSRPAPAEGRRELNNISQQTKFKCFVGNNRKRNKNFKLLIYIQLPLKCVFIGGSSSRNNKQAAEGCEDEWKKEAVRLFVCVCVGAQRLLVGH